MGSSHYDVKTFRSSQSVGYLVKLAHVLIWERATEALTSRELNFTQWTVLTKLREGAAVTASDLCRELRHDTGALTRLLDQLEERHLIERERSKQDRRVVRLKLTPAGRKVAVELTPLVVDQLNGALSDFSEGEFQELTQLLKKLIATMTAGGFADHVPVSEPATRNRDRPESC